MLWLSAAHLTATGTLPPAVLHRWATACWWPVLPSCSCIFDVAARAVRGVPCRVQAVRSSGLPRRNDSRKKSICKRLPRATLLTARSSDASDAHPPFAALLTFSHLWLLLNRWVARDILIAEHPWMQMLCFADGCLS